MNLSKIMLAAMSTSLIVSSVACSKAKSRKGEAVASPAAPVAEQKINLAECPDMVGTWTFNGPIKKNYSDSFTLTRGEDGNGPLMFSTNDYDRFVEINGEPQEVVQSLSQDKMSIVGTCKAQSLFMTITSSKGEVIKTEWRGDKNELEGMLISSQNGKKSFQKFHRNLERVITVPKAAAPAVSAPAAPAPALEPEGLVAPVVEPPPLSTEAE